MQYNVLEIERKWQARWESNSDAQTKLHGSGKKYYCLDMFPYPSGSGLHVGHWRGYVLSDVYARIKWLEGYNVLHPMGWDAFGLPAENDALKKGIHPRISTDKNIATFKEQLKKYQTDPATAEIGELGFGTQLLPFSGRDIQDEKVLGTFHVATGRSDHLGGELTLHRFKNAKNATHDDILFAPHKTPEIKIKEVRMHRNGKRISLIKNYQPMPYIKSLLSAKS